MSKKMLNKNFLEDYLTKKVLSGNGDLLANLPNLASEDCEKVVFNVIGFQLTKKCYFGLVFPIHDNSHIDELRNLSNGYLEVKNGTVKMGVTKLENLQSILQAPYLKPGSVHSLTSAFT